MEPREFSQRAKQLLAKATRLCALCPDSDLERWMEAAKRRGLTWTKALQWVISQHPGVY